MKCGVYKITGPNGRCYVGQSINISERWRYHRKELRAGRHGNEKMQNAWSKYGEANFFFEIVALCSVKELDRVEQQTMDTLDAVHHGYNIVPLAGSNLGMSNPVVAERNRRMRGEKHPSFGKPRPDLAERNRLGSPMKGRKRPDVSARARLRGPLHFNFGKKSPKKGVKIGPVKLRESAVRIRQRLLAGESVAELARKFKVKWCTIARIRDEHGFVTNSFVTNGEVTP